MKRIYIILIVFIPSYISSYAQTEFYNFRHSDYLNPGYLAQAVNTNLDSLQLDSLISAYKTENQIPGLATMIVKNDKVIWSKNYGYRNREQQLPVEDSTNFLLASVSKIVVATAVMQLWENGLIDLDKNINNYLPDAFTVINPHFPNDSITTKMLLNHTSSIQDNMNLLWTLNICGDSPIPFSSFLADYLEPGGKYYNQSNFYNYKPGQTFNYSNVGASLLALIVENLSGKSFAEYCEDSIFIPLSMNSASWFLEGMNPDKIATPYNYDTYGSIASHPICNQGFPYYPSGSLRANKIELSHFLLAYLNNGMYNNHRILDSATVAYILSDQLGYDIEGAMLQGLIWIKMLIYNGSVWGHIGDWYGAETLVGIDPSEKYLIVWLQNWSEAVPPYLKMLGLISYFTQYAYMYGSIYSLKPTVVNPFIEINKDSVLFLTKFSNIFKHQFKPYLIYENTDSTVIDSLTLYDDGLHGDLLSNDGTYGGYIPPQKIEDFYSLSISTVDNQTGKYFSTPDIFRFTTVGPVVLDSILIQSLAGSYTVKPYLKNKSKSAAIRDASVKLISNDPWVASISLWVNNISNINPGASTGSSTFRIQYIDSLFPGYFNFKVEITSDGWTYWTDSTKVIVTGVEELAEQPLIFNLKQNYPNPFNPTTNIQYSIASRQLVELKIYNVLGQEIQTLVNEEKPSGNYQIEFDAANLPSGVYFYRIQAGSFNQVRKMLLIK